MAADQIGRSRAEELVITMIEHARASPRTHYDLAITPIDSVDQVVGLVHLVCAEDVDNFAVAIAREHWRRGYATDACATALDLGFLRLGLRMLRVVMLAGNKPIITLAQRFGMTYQETVLDDSDGAQDGGVPYVRYTMPAQEWISQRQHVLDHGHIAGWRG